MTACVHIPVLLDEVVEHLALWPDGVYVDCTFGRGGHSRALLSGLGGGAQLFALDRDPQAVLAMSSIQDKRFKGLHGAFAEVDILLQQHLFNHAVDGIMMDIGVSSPQLDAPERGFSFRFDGPLDMRMDPGCGLSAADFVNSASVRELAEVIKNYGEERYAFQVATAIVASRQKGAILTTGQLADIVAAAVRTRQPGQNPATRTFQALRIYVNQELTQLQQGLDAAFSILKPGGRLVVISFHSLEDRMVKQFIDKRAKPEAYQDVKLRRLPVQAPVPTMRKVARIHPSERECELNPRARSATLRIAEKI